ncbi:MAG TPA: C40 family peptidase [Chryseosolibacter sp.]|nr:C40 family peptidase [Chryseosolibacter sp.]
MEEIDFGVCRLSVVSVRKEPADQSEQVTQLLFGDHYSVYEISPDEKWIRIIIHFDQYEGWIDRKQHQPITREYFHYINHADFKITTDLTSTLLYNKSPQMILLGSIIPIASSELFRMEEQFAFNGEAKNLGQRRELEFLRAIAMKYLNSPYQWGGKGPFGIDCSGFTQMVFKICGYKLLRDAGQQVAQGKAVKSLQSARPGDLAFFQNAKGATSHTGIFLGDNKVIHASGKVRIDGMTEEGIQHADTKQITHRLSSIRRIMPD